MELFGLLTLILLAVLIFKLPELGLVLCVLIGSLIKGIIQPYFGPIDISAYLFIVTFSSILGRMAIERKKISLPINSINIGVFMFIMLLLASLLWTPLLKQGIETFLRFIFLTISMMYITFIWAINTDRIKRILFIFSGAALLYGLVLTAWLFPLGGLAHVVVRGIFPETPAIAVAAILAAGILITLITKELIVTRYRRLLVSVLSMIALVSLIATGSRGPLLALGVGSIIYFMYYVKRERRVPVLSLLPLVAVGILSFIFFPAQLLVRHFLVFDLAGPGVASRLALWGFAVENFTDWFFGGSGLFGFAAYYWPDVPIAYFQIFGHHVHNIFLDVFAHVGFFGLLVFIWLIGSLLCKGMKLTKAKERTFYLLGLASLVALIVFLVNGLFSATLIDTRDIWFFGGIILALQRVKIQERTLYGE